MSKTISIPATPCIMRRAGCAIDPPPCVRDRSPATPFSPASFDTQLESAVSDALRHPLDPEVMREPAEPIAKKALVERRGALHRRHRRFSRRGAVLRRRRARLPAGRRRAVDIRRDRAVDQGALFQPGRRLSPKPAISEFQAILASSRSGQCGDVGAVGTIAPAIHAVAREAGSSGTAACKPMTHMEDMTMPDDRPTAILFSRSLP